jgi:hypothetical protein
VPDNEMFSYNIYVYFSRKQREREINFNLFIIYLDILIIVNCDGYNSL